jgi:K+/H+ antiporter YhaU regulatory subunit KhtT
MPTTEDLVAAMTLEEKCTLLSGANAWTIPGCERLGISSWTVSDGPIGVRGRGRSPALCLPSSTAWAATWDVDLVAEMGAAVAREAKDRAIQMVLGPTVNMHRDPRGGRHFECYSEDPFLTGAVAVARRANPRLGILVRTRYVADVDDLIALGANAVIPEEFETSVEIFSRVLREYHVPDHVVSQQEELIRSGTYRILRERVSSRDEGLMSEFELFLRQKVIEIFYVSPDSPWAGRPLGDLPAGNGAGIVLLAVLREDHAIVQPSTEERIEAGDKLVFFGGHAPLATVLEELSRAGR